MWTIPTIMGEIKQGDMPADKVVFHPDRVKNADTNM